MAQHDATNFANLFQYADDDNDFVLPTNIQGPGHYLNLHDHTAGLGLASGRIASGLAAARPAFAAGLVYLATDTGVLSVSDAAGWHVVLLADVLATISAIWKFDGGLDFKQIATPANPSAGYNRVYPKSDGVLYTLNSAGLETAIGPIPVGTVLPLMGTSLPQGFLWWDGASQLIATYPTLSAAIRPTLGGVDGTHFYCGDLRSRYPMGADNYGQGAASRASGSVALGNTSGADTVTLTTAQLPHLSYTAAVSNLQVDIPANHAGVGPSTTTVTSDGNGPDGTITAATLHDGTVAVSDGNAGGSHSIRPLNQIHNFIVKY